jgi:hypothetical protein
MIETCYYSVIVNVNELNGFFCLKIEEVNVDVHVLIFFAFE